MNQESEIKIKLREIAQESLKDKDNKFNMIELTKFIEGGEKMYETLINFKELLNEESHMYHNIFNNHENLKTIEDLANLIFFNGVLGANNIFYINLNIFEPYIVRALLSKIEDKIRTPVEKDFIYCLKNIETEEGLLFISEKGIEEYEKHYNLEIKKHVKYMFMLNKEGDEKNE